MDTRAKVCLIIGGILLLVGIGGFALGVSQFDDIEDAQPDFVLEEVTNGTLIIEDEDGQGDVGFVFFVKGEFVNEFNATDNKWDHCETTNVTVIEKPDLVRAEWSSEGYSLEGDFYYEVEPYLGCWSGDEETTNQVFYHENDSFIKLGRACYGCGAGVFTFESNQPVFVLNEDDWSEAGTPIAILVLGFISGFGSLCCGIIFLIVGTILVFTLKDEDVQPMMMNQDGQFVIQQSTSSTSQVTQSTPSDTVVEPYSFPSTGGTELETKEE
tara:strand:- start:202 stop:1008 length:807 start_codon:yes stop_codon:yes gene_type:complete